MKGRLEGAGVPVSDIPIQPMGLALLEGSMSPGNRRRMSKLAASAPHAAPAAAAANIEDAAGEDASTADADVSTSSPSQLAPPAVPPIDVSNFVVTMSMASHSLQVLLIPLPHPPL